MCGCVLCGTREIQPVSKGRLLAEKGARHDAAGEAGWKSDEVVVVKKLANKILRLDGGAGGAKGLGKEESREVTPCWGLRAPRNRTLATWGAWAGGTGNDWVGGGPRRNGFGC